MTEFIIKFTKDDKGNFNTQHGGDMLIPDIMIGLEMLKKSMLEMLTTQRPQLTFPGGKTGKIDFPPFRPKTLP